ncbi:Protein CBR-NHR-94 [Caenorhabditis briggsae]|uniref:Protein CBR-NHR-94 n=1 Tax=Caenorhabditis briggsae TaxID=6238 RepID=A8XUP1_CAEBR|nr:Protein CBR-NHR-94 [Caenorhabditis briggsae]CAP36366.1 Protein CBR-NHR-94 [Caenorhabditis briggsae]
MGEKQAVDHTPTQSPNLVTIRFLFQFVMVVAEMQLCQVCEKPISSESHFGIQSCKACAAFFRRYVNSTKPQKECNCGREKNPCKYCKWELCVNAGMLTSKVQHRRDKNPRTTSGSFLETSLIPLRSIDRIADALGNYNELGRERKVIHESSSTSLVDFYEYTTISMKDAPMFRKLLMNTIQELEYLSDIDKNNLFSNFYPKWTLFESGIQAFKNSEIHTFFAANGKPAKQISKFYRDCMPSKKRMDDKEVLQIFEPYWNSYYGHVAYPLFELKFDAMELMAILILMLLDPGYSNISEECSEMCYNMRNVIRKQLKGYYLERNIPTERIFTTNEALLLVEKADSWLQEEVQMCGVHSVPVDENFRQMVMTPKL